MKTYTSAEIKPEARGELSFFVCRDKEYPDSYKSFVGILDKDSTPITQEEGEVCRVYKGLNYLYALKLDYELEQETVDLEILDSLVTK